MRIFLSPSVTALELCCKVTDSKHGSTHRVRPAEGSLERLLGRAVAGYLVEVKLIGLADQGGR